MRSCNITPICPMIDVPIGLGSHFVRYVHNHLYEAYNVNYWILILNERMKQKLDLPLIDDIFNNIIGTHDPNLQMSLLHYSLP